jgi:hypothetical protein
MNVVLRLIPAWLIIAIVIAACTNGAAAPTPTPPAPAAATAPPRPTSSAASSIPSAAGTLQVSGGPNGFLSVLAVSCSPPGQAEAVTIKGRIENRLFDVDISAPAAGGFQIGQSAASVQMSSQTPDDRSVSRWAANQSQAAGGGSLSVNNGGGSIDADLQGIAGTGGSVHLRGGWSCPNT